MNRKLYEEIVKTQLMNGQEDMDGIRKRVERYLEGRLQKVLYIKGETICKEGKLGNKVYFLERGKVIILKKDAGSNERSGGYLMPGEFFGFSSIVEAPEAVCFKAFTNCSIYAIEASAIKSLMEDTGASRDFIINVFVNTIRIRSVRQRNMVTGGCRTSFVSFILEHLEGCGRLDDKGNIIISLDVDLTDIAWILNMTRETLSRIVSEMKKQGIIDTKRRYIKIIDMERFMA